MSKSDLDQYKPEFHGTEAPYALPSDNHEQQRLDDQHDAWKALMQDRIFHAPIQNPKKVVDLGCGTGVATRLLADTYPAAQIEGVELRELPGHREGRSNIQWTYGDARSVVPERIPPASVDYFFQRLLHMGMTDWGDYVQHAVRTLQPGGWLELQEWNWQIMEDGKNVTDQWPWQQDLVARAWETKRIDWRCAEKLEGWMRDAGLVDVQAVSYLAPLGFWDVAARPQSKVMATYLAKWWPTVCYVCIPTIMGDADPKRNGQMQEQMLKDLELAQSKQRKAYEIVVVIGRKP